MSTEYGVWSGEAGGFIDRGFYAFDAAEVAAEEYAADEPDGEYSARALCADHSDEEEPADACEECATDGGGEDEDDEDAEDDE